MSYDIAIIVLLTSLILSLPFVIFGAFALHEWLMTRPMDSLETEEERDAWNKAWLIVQQEERERNKTPYSSYEEFKNDSSDNRKLRVPLTDWSKID